MDHEFKMRQLDLEREALELEKLERKAVHNAQERDSTREHEFKLAQLQAQAELSSAPTASGHGAAHQLRVDSAAKLLPKMVSEVDQVVIPHPLRNKILEVAHDIPASGHLGIHKT